MFCATLRTVRQQTSVWAYCFKRHDNFQRTTESSHKPAMPNIIWKCTFGTFGSECMMCDRTTAIHTNIYKYLHGTLWWAQNTTTVNTRKQRALASQHVLKLVWKCASTMPASECTLSYSTKNKTKHPKVHVQETRFVSAEKTSVRKMKINDVWKRLCHVGLRTWKQTRIPKNPSRRTDHLQETSNDSPQANMF